MRGSYCFLSPNALISAIMHYLQQQGDCASGSSNNAWAMLNCEFTCTDGACLAADACKDDSSGCNYWQGLGYCDQSSVV